VTEPDGADYDLVIVGAGISGLAAAWFFQQRQGPRAKILLLENHDDFGGHAKRNEFAVDGQTRLSYGGSQTMQAPGRYSRTTVSLLADLGVKLDRFASAYDMTFFQRHALRPATFFDGRTYGKASLVPYTLTDLSWGVPGIVKSVLSPEQAVERMPLTSRTKAQLLRILTGSDRALDRISPEARLNYAGTTPYFTFLREQFHVDDPEVFRLLRSLPAEYTGLGADALSTLEALALELPGITERAVGNLKAEGTLYPSLPRRQRLDRPPPGPAVDFGRRTRLDDGRRGAGSIRLRPARSPGFLRQTPTEQHSRPRHP
jgi:spermidine dehydrogenase